MKPTTYPLRTQISLSPQLKRKIEERSSISNESLSEYLRRAAIIRMALEDMEVQTLKRVARSVVGSVAPGSSGWSAGTNAVAWQRKTRRDENHHRP